MPDWKGPRASFSRRQTTAFSHLRSADVTTIGTKAEQGGVARSRGSLLQPKEMIRWNLSSGGGTRLEQRQNMAGRRVRARAHTHRCALLSPPPPPPLTFPVLGHLSFLYRSSSHTQDNRFHSPQRFHPSYLLYHTTGTFRSLNCPGSPLILL